MDEDNLISILKSKLSSSLSISDRLSYSIHKADKQKMHSLTVEQIKNLNDDDLELLDAYLFRYGSLVSSIQDGLFKTIAEIEMEPFNKLSNRDKTNLMERLGALPSAQAFSSLAIIRNKLMHEYPDDIDKHAERINSIIDKSSDLIYVLIDIIKYSEKFDIHMDLQEYHHLSAEISQNDQSQEQFQRPSL